MDWIGEKLGIQKQADWYSQTQHKIEKAGGDRLLRLYGHSLPASLKAVYPEFEWNNGLFECAPRNHWKELSNRRKMMDWIADQLGVVTQQDWYNITTQQVYEHGGQGLLFSYYGRSLHAALESVYPEFEWNAFLFPSVSKHHWKSKENQRRTFDWVANQLGIKTQEDWYSLRTDDLKSFPKAHKLITNHYNNSLFAALQVVYPEYEWNALFLPSASSTSKKYDISFHRSVLDDVATHLGIKTQHDWYNVSSEEVKKSRRAGVDKLWMKYNSLFHALTSAYSEFDWNPLMFQSAPKNVIDNASTQTISEWLHTSGAVL